MKKLSTLISKSGLVKGLAAAAVTAAVFLATTFTAMAAEGKVTAVVNIRKEASTDSEVVGSTTKDKTIDILEAVKDSSGTVWYKVSVAGGGYGYIRSDFVQTSETIEVSSGSASNSNTDSGTKPAETVPTSIGEQQAVIKSDKNVNIRSGASTQHDLVTALPDGTSITLIGEANDSAGNKWYQMTCSYNGKTIEGYVRSDLITIGTAQGTGSENAENAENTENTENTEGSPEEGTDTEGIEGENTENTPEADQEDASQQEPVEEHKDYEVVYAQNSAGEYGYYLVDYVAGHQLSINELNKLLEVVDSVEAANRLQTQIQNEKIVIIILAAVIVLLFIVLTVLLFKLRDLSYDYEEEEEEEEEEPVPVKKRLRKRAVEEEEEEEPVPVKKKRSAPSKAEERPAKAGRNQARAKEDRELYAAEAKEPVKKPVPRKPQNFLIDDDEFEFEFLNMDDKDL